MFYKLAYGVCCYLLAFGMFNQAWRYQDAGDDALLLALCTAAVYLIGTGSYFCVLALKSTVHLSNTHSTSSRR